MVQMRPKADGLILVLFKLVIVSVRNQGMCIAFVLEVRGCVTGRPVARFTGGGGHHIFRERFLFLKFFRF